jgi:signal transduction histidine kinase
MTQHADASSELDGIARGDILVVDDTPANLLSFEAALGDLAGSVARARSGAEALRLLLERDFALIILDVQMPGMNGFETARLIRERRRSKHTPIIFVTAHDHADQDVLQAYALGAVDFMFKPFAREVLRAKASVLIKLQQRTAEVARQAVLLREHELRENQRAIERERDAWQAETMQRQIKQMVEENRRKDEFLAVLSHELRNPLSPVVTGLEVLRRWLANTPGVDPRLHRLRDGMERQARHIIRLTDDLLDIARISTGKFELRRTRVRLRDAVEQALLFVQPMIDERKQELVVELPDAPVTLDADEARLTQVLANLLSNATRYTPAHGHIRLHCQVVDRRLEIRVQDDGQGIARELLPHVFDIFTQQRSGYGGGMGLGLSLVKQLVELHGGTVEARSEGLGRGSEFAIQLPLAAAADVETRADTPVPRAAAGANRKQNCLRIVVVDDSEDIRDAMRELLTMLGHEVQVAGEGDAGVELILKAEPDVAIVDIGMPVKDGFDVARRVRAALGRDKVRLVAMTGFGQETDRQRSKDAGFDAHLVKPAHAEAIEKTLSFERGS